MRVILVGCSKVKARARCEAQWLYVSPLFRKSALWARKEVARGHADGWLILSAKWGVLSPDDLVDPYEKRLGELDRAGRERWAAQAWGQLGERTGERARELLELVILAGRAYVEPLRPGADRRGVRLVEPLAGLQIGERIGWLNRELGIQPDPLRGLTRV